MITTCIGTNNTLHYLKLAVESVRQNHYLTGSPLIVCAENCDDGTDEWVWENRKKYNITPIILHTDEDDELGIGSGMNIMADEVDTEFINFIHADMWVAPDQDLGLYNMFDKYPDEKLVVSSHRIQPSVFPGDTGRPGTLIVDNDMFGELHDNFDSNFFDEWATDFSELNDVNVPKGEGVSFMIRKTDWDEIGGCDPIFDPTSFDDMDLFLRMQEAGYKFVLTSDSVVYHFGGRSFNGHFSDDKMDNRSPRQAFYEQRNAQRFYEKWGGSPKFDEYEMIVGVGK